MDDYIVSGDYNNAINRAIQAIKIYDEEREYDSSMLLLEKMIEIAELQHDNLSVMKYVDHLKTRALLSRNKEKYHSISKTYANLPETPTSMLLKNATATSDGHIIVETVDIQTIFGDFDPVPDIPFLKFSDHDSAIRIIEDYFDEGRYVINLLDISTSLHQSVNLDVGDPEEVNIVDRDHTFKIG